MVWHLRILRGEPWAIGQDVETERRAWCSGQSPPSEQERRWCGVFDLTADNSSDTQTT